METQLIETQADDDIHEFNNDIFENEYMGYESEQYSDDERDANSLALGWKKRGITRLSKFRNDYGKPGGLKLSVAIDDLYRITGPNRAIFSSFLGDLVREHIGLKTLSWKKVDTEARDKLWEEITVHNILFIMHLHYICATT